MSASTGRNDKGLQFEDLEPVEVCREAPDATELYGQSGVTSIPPTPTHGDDGIEELTPRGNPAEVELDIMDGNAKEHRCKDPEPIEDCQPEDRG